jgi:hypothetical protein
VNRSGGRIGAVAGGRCGVCDARSTSPQRHAAATNVRDRRIFIVGRILCPRGPGYLTPGPV